MHLSIILTKFKRKRQLQQPAVIKLQFISSFDDFIAIELQFLHVPFFYCETIYSLYGNKKMLGSFSSFSFNLPFL